MRILITGGLGFIGSHLIASMGKEHSITIIDKIDFSERNLFLKQFELGHVQFVADNVCNTNLLDKVLPRVDLVIHCAANSNTRACHSNMMIDLEDGIKTTWVLAEKLIEHKCKRVIFFLKSACLWQ